MEGEVKGKTFKMKGHTLPGINQRSEGNTDLPDGRSKSSAFQQDFMDAGVAASQAMATQRRNQPQGPMGGVGTGVPGAFPSKPSMAKHTATQGSSKKSYSANRDVVNTHNASSATDSHFGDPHGPKPSAAKIYKKPKGKKTEY